MKYDYEKTVKLCEIIGKAMGFIQYRAIVYRLEKNYEAAERYESMYQQLETEFKNTYNQTTHETTN